jgi:hypothetical protein
LLTRCGARPLRHASPVHTAGSAVPDTGAAAVRGVRQKQLTAAPAPLRHLSTHSNHGTLFSPTLTQDYLPCFWLCQASRSARQPCTRESSRMRSIGCAFAWRGTAGLVRAVLPNPNRQTPTDRHETRCTVHSSLHVPCTLYHTLRMAQQWILRLGSVFRVTLLPHRCFVV